MSFPIFRTLYKTVYKILDKRIIAGILKLCLGLYRNPWFLIKKANKKYHLINSAININRVIIKDIILPSTVNKFSKEFIELKVISYIDFFLGYNQIFIDKRSRDISAIMTLRGLLR